MDKTQTLLTCLIEECAEVQQAATKILRFGLYAGDPGSDTNNQIDLAYEIIDLIAICEMLRDLNVIPYEMCGLYNPNNRTLLQAKKDKVIKHMPNDIEE